MAKAKKADGTLEAAAVTIGHLLGRAVGTVDTLKERGESLVADAGELLGEGKARAAAVRKRANAKTSAAKKAVRKAGKRATRTVRKARKTVTKAVAKTKKAVRKRR